MTAVRTLLVAWLIAVLAPLLPAQEITLESRAREVQALLAAEPRIPPGLFDESFLKAVPADQLVATCQQLYGQLGAIRELKLSRAQGEWQANYQAVLEKGFGMPVSLTCDAKPPHAIVGLWFGPPVPLVEDLAGVVDALKKLRGKVSFGAWKLGEKLEPLAELESDTPLALGSAFKLYVLGCLVHEVGAGRAKLESLAPLQARLCSLPSGRLQSWPVGTPLTLAGLACAMISESDNTATDHLLFALGREKVEAMLAPMGNEHAARSLPFLGTAEMFRLKLFQDGALADAYAKLDEKARREFLARELDPAKIPIDSLTAAAGSWSKPRHVEDLEWFASARDLARAMDWLRRETEGERTRLLRDVLAINPGLAIDKQVFPFVGFKGGSEPGVLDLTFLLQHRSGTWYALTVTWNDPKRKLDEDKLTGLATRAIELVGAAAGR